MVAQSKLLQRRYTADIATRHGSVMLAIECIARNAINSRMALMNGQASSAQTIVQTDSERRLGVRLSTHICSAIDVLNLGIVFVDGDSRILYANRAAKHLLRDRKGLTVYNGLLRAETPKGTQALARQLRVALSAGPCGGLAEAGAVALPTSSGRSLTVLVFPCRNDLTLGSEDPTAILFISDPAAQPEIDEHYIARLYDLTPAEARLLRALLDGKRLSDYAREAGIALFTVKGYLKQIFSKTGASRQADLVRIVLADPILRLVPTQRTQFDRAG